MHRRCYQGDDIDKSIFLKTDGAEEIIEAVQAISLLV